MEITPQYSYEEAAPYVPYDLELFRENSRKYYRKEPVSPGFDPKNSLRVAVAWDFPSVSFEDVVRILKGDPTNFSESIVETVTLRAVGRVRGDKVIRWIGKERFIQIARRYIEKVEKEPGMHYVENARQWANLGGE